MYYNFLKIDVLIRLCYCQMLMSANLTKNMIKTMIKSIINDKNVSNVFGREIVDRIVDLQSTFDIPLDNQSISYYLCFGFRGILKRIETVPLNLIRLRPT